MKELILKYGLLIYFIIIFYILLAAWFVLVAANPGHWGPILQVACLIFGVVLFLIGAFTAVLIVIDARQAIRFSQRKCIRCGYDLRGTEDCDLCPECGEPGMVEFCFEGLYQL